MAVQGVGQKPLGEGAEIEVAMGAGARGLAAGGGAVILWWWWRLHPTPRPFAQRVWIDVPHHFVTRRRLRQVLVPVPGEWLLEVGVGSGRYALPAVRWSSGGSLSAIRDASSLPARNSADRTYRSTWSLYGGSSWRSRHSARNCSLTSYS
ncbi:MAG: hypothetical protein ACR2MP_18380, partial [Streptosporangiaceae bacterium]